MRILFALPGLHRVDRGAEIAFISVASELARGGDMVTLIGSGPQRPGAPYSYKQAWVAPRERFERFPKVPALRNETAWEELSFIPGFLRTYRPADFDVTLTCAYPWLNWSLRARRSGGKKPAHVFVTQNGDWPARANNSEFRMFGCEGLVCTNPDYFEVNRGRYPSALIPNGVDLDRFRKGASDRAAFGLPEGAKVVLMVSALIESKKVALGIEAVSRLPDVHLAVAGDGPLRDQLATMARDLLPGRFHNFTVTADRMPDLYRSADMFLHLSRDESFGNVFVEAMASQIPTVAWDLPNTRWITGDTAFLTPDGDLPALSSAIAAALEAGSDRQSLDHRAEGFSWPLIAGQYRQFLSQVINGERRA